MVKGLTRAFSCRIFAGRKQTLNTATMDFKRIAHNGYLKVCEMFRFDDRIKYMLEIADEK
jgi:hypothetical protein